MLCANPFTRRPARWIMPLLVATAVPIAVAPASPATAATYPVFTVLDEGPVTPSMRISPDGVWVVYTDQPTDTLKSVPVSGGRVRTLISDPGSWEISPTSSYVVSNDGESVSSHTVAGGPATELFAARGDYVDLVDITPDGQRVLFRSDRGNADFDFDLYSVPIGGGNAVRLNPPLGAGRTVEAFTMSPDGATVAYRADQNADEVFEMFTVPAAGGSPRRVSAPLVAGGDVENSADFAPDSTWLTYVADGNTDGVIELYGVDLATGAVARLSPNERAVQQLGFSPDSQRTLFVTSTASTPRSIVTSNRSGIARTVLRAVTSPVNLRAETVGDLVLLSTEAGTSGSHRLELVRFDGTDLRTLDAGDALQWLVGPGADDIAFVHGPANAASIITNELDGTGASTTIATNIDFVTRFARLEALTADGTVILHGRDGSPYTISAGITEPVFVGGAFTETIGYAVSPDGRRIAAVRDQFADGTYALVARGPETTYDEWSRFVPLSPQRILDTRLDAQIGYSGGKPLAGETVRLKVLGRGGVPDAPDISAVVLNVTATGASNPGYVTAWPAGATPPLASNINLERQNQTRPNLVTVAIGAAGSVDLFTLSGTHIVADVFGYYTGAGVSGGVSTDGRLFPLSPSRVLDTRSDTKPTAGSTTVLQLRGRGGLPDGGVSAVVLNVTATQPTGPSYVTVWPTGIARPTTSNLNVDAGGQTVANQVIVPVGTDGSVSLFTLEATHLVVDVAGWFTGVGELEGHSGLYTSFSPIRMLDTRPGSRQLWTGPKPTAGSTVPVTFTAPGQGAMALTVNVTVTEPEAPGFVTAWPSNLSRPLASNVNVTDTGQTIANHATVLTGLPFEDITLYTLTSAHLIADVTGYYSR